MMMKKIGLLVIMVALFANIGLSWVSGYQNKININYSSDFMNATNMSFKFNVSIGCVDTVYCNDSAVYFLWSNGTNETIPYYFENVSALWVKIPQLNNTNNSIDVYFNSTNITRNGYYNISKTFIQAYDFENETGNIYSFGALFGQPVTNSTTYFKGIKSLSLTYPANGVQLIDALGSDTLPIFVEMYYKCNINSASSTFYWGSGINTTWGSTLRYMSTPNNNEWTKVRIEKNDPSVREGNITQLGVTYLTSAGADGNGGQFLFPYAGDTTVCNIDEWYFGKYYPQGRIYYVNGGVENAPIPEGFLILNYINPDFLNISADCDNITMTINPHTSEYPILNCSLWLNDTLNYTASQPLNDSAVETSLNLANGSYAFFWDCYAGALYNTTINYTLNVMCAYPGLNYSSATSCPACLNCVPTRQYCADNTTLYQEYYRRVTVNGALTVCNETRLTDCPYGCNSKSNACALSTYEAWINNGMLFIGVLIAFIVVVMAGRKAKGIRF